MKKIFVVTDNRFIYKEFNRITKDIAIELDYFCSPKSEMIFQSELMDGSIKVLSLKEQYTELIIAQYFLGFSCHSKQLFPAALVNTITCINIHPGFNPYNRGWFPQVFSIIDKSPIGVTIHLMDEKIDHGNIIIQEEIKVYSYDTSIDVYNRVLAKEVELLESCIHDIISLNISPKQPFSEGNYNSLEDYKKICKIDLNKQVTMGEAIDLLRALTHPPYKNAYFIDKENKKVFVTISMEPEK